MRFDVHTIRVYLVNELIATPQVKEVWHDGSDVVILDFKTGESVSIHMIERFMSVDEIDYIFRHNTEHGHYTLLILWSDMFMPSDGQYYEPSDWMFALLQLYGGKIYAYDAWREEPYVYTVHFHRVNRSRQFLVKHGEDIIVNKIGVQDVETDMPFFRGRWRVARFDGYLGETPTNYWQPQDGGEEHGSLRYYLNLLGVHSKSSREEVKQAYRELARKHHPDMNTGNDTTVQMQQINEAYQRVLAYLDGQTPQ